MKISKWIVELLHKYNIFTIDTPHLDRFVRGIEEIRADVKVVQESLLKEKVLIEKELAKKESIIESLLEAIPDMVWCKDLNGKYIYANSTIRNDLLCSTNPIGLDDVALAKLAKKKYGDTNHTFGEKCANSDKIVIESGKAQRFIENGNVRGKHLELEVHKNVVRNQDGDIIATVGTGRDITEYVEASKSTQCNGCSIIDSFKKYRYGD